MTVRFRSLDQVTRHLCCWLLLMFCGLPAPVNAAWETGTSGSEESAAVPGIPQSLALARNARRMAVGSDLPPSLNLFDPDNGNLLSSLPLPTKPQAVALSGNGDLAYVILQDASVVTVVDIASSSGGTATIKAQWQVGGQPAALLLNSAGDLLFVADRLGRLLTLNTVNGQLVSSMNVVGKPMRLAMAQGGSRLLVGTEGGDLLTVDLATLSITNQINLGSEITGLAWWETDSLAIAIPKNQDKWILVNPFSTVVDTSKAVEGRVEGVAVDAQGDDAYVTTSDDLSVTRLNLTQRTNEGRHRLNDTPGDILFDPVARMIYVALPMEGKVLRLDPLQVNLAPPLSMRFRYRDVAVHQTKEQAFAVTERLSGLLTRWRLSDRFRTVLPLKVAARKLAIDQASNLAVVGVNGPGHEIRFVDIAPSSPVLLKEVVGVGAEILAIAADPVGKRSIILVNDPRGIRILDHVTRQQTAALQTSEIYRAVALHTQSGKAYLLSDHRRLVVLDLVSHVFSPSIALDFEPGDIAIDETLNLAAVTSPRDNRLRILDLNSLEVTRTVELPKHPRRLAVHSDHHVAVVASKESNALTLIDLVLDDAEPQALNTVERPLSLAVANKLNQALVLSGEKDDLIFVSMPSPRPALSKLVPDETPSGSAALVLKVQGYRFLQSSRVYWDGTPLTTRHIDARNLEADVPAALVQNPGTPLVLVRNPAPGGDSNALTFQITAPAPVLDFVTPDFLLANGTEQAITLTGSRFMTTSQAQFGGKSIPTIYVSSTALTAMVPGNFLQTPTTIPVTVLTPLGGLSNAISVEVRDDDQKLTLTAITPNSGEPGIQVTLTGTGFDPDPTKNVVTFVGNAIATIVQANSTQLTVVVPTTAQTGPVSVSNTRGTVAGPVFTVTRANDFNLVATPASVTVLQNSAATVTVQLASSGTNPFTGLAALSATGLPPGMTAGFEPPNLTNNQFGALRLNAAATTPVGVYPIAVIASAVISGAKQTRTAIVNVTVQASDGVTGVKGRFVTPAGAGIPGVLVSHENLMTSSDSAGNFLLTGLPSGTITLRFDATPYHPVYPIWPHMLELPASQITVLPDWTVNPPPTDDKFTPFVESSQDQIITDPRYPGLEIKIPAGVSIVGWDGVKKNRMAVERLEPDRLPVTPPPIATKSVYQLYFGTAMGGIPTAPIPVTLPNDLGLDPGERTRLWYYDGSPMGGSGEWKQGGFGTVSADGKTIVTDAGAGIPRFCGVCGLPCFEQNQQKQPNTPPPDPDGAEPKSCKPVTYATGLEAPDEVDLFVSSLHGLVVNRIYSQYDPFNKIAGTVLSMGLNWTLSYDVALMNLSGSLVRLILPGNSRVDFNPDGLGGFATSKDRRFDAAVLKQDAGGWLLTYNDGSQWRFAPFGIAGLQYLIEQRDTAGNVLTLQRQSDGKLSAASSGGRQLSFQYGTNGLVSEVRDDLGRRVLYSYNADNRIETVTAPDGGLTRYTYEDATKLAWADGVQVAAVGYAIPLPPDPCASLPAVDRQQYRIKSITYPGKIAPIVMDYGGSGRVLRQVQEDGRELKFTYKLLGACSRAQGNLTSTLTNLESWEQFQTGEKISHPGSVQETVVTDNAGNTMTQRFNTIGLANEVLDSQGQKTVYTRDANNRITAITDPLGRTVRYQYDTKGNRTRVTDPDGRILDLTYDVKWNAVTSATRFLDNGEPVTTRYEYDSQNGLLTKLTDPLGNITRFTYTANGLLKSVTDPLGNVSPLDYSPEGDLISVRDPLGNETAFDRDAVGRLTAGTDPLGFTTANALSAIDQVTQITDAAGGATQLAYHADRRLASVVDALNHTVESYEYDPVGRLTRKTDAKGKSTDYGYDAAGRLLSITDRLGRTTQLSRDSEGRISKAQLPDGGVLEFAYDAAGRLVFLSETGVPSPTSFEYTYDNRDLLIQEIAHQQGRTHTLTFKYDALGRRIERQVDGVDTTLYAYDKAGRITGIRFNAEPPVTYTWDAVGRLGVKELSNGVRMEYQYDAASRLTKITYRKPDGSEIDSIGYTYDAKGQRISRTMNFPSRDETPMAATYDDANRLLTLTLMATGETFDLTYDDNGNLVSKASRSTGAKTIYAWDQRNRLSAIVAPDVSASFHYDARGRRISRTINGVETSFLYDGPQAITEIRTGIAYAKLLTGLRVDENLARITKDSIRHYLIDELSSTISKTNNELTSLENFAYSPFGETTPPSNSAEHSIGYTGREIDGEALYYFRLRYYDPVIKRFISEDLAGTQYGSNVFLYVKNNPINMIDPYGLKETYAGAQGSAFLFFGGVSGGYSMSSGGCENIQFCLNMGLGAYAGFQAGSGFQSDGANGLSGFFGIGGEVGLGVSGSGRFGGTIGTEVNSCGTKNDFVGVQGQIDTSIAGGGGQIGTNGNQWSYGRNVGGGVGAWVGPSVCLNITNNCGSIPKK